MSVANLFNAVINPVVTGANLISTVTNVANTKAATWASIAQKEAEFDLALHNETVVDTYALKLLNHTKQVAQLVGADQAAFNECRKVFTK